jgi:hypothetical protein
MILEATIYIFQPLHFSYLSLIFHILEREKRCWFLNVKVWKCTNILQQCEALYIVGMVRNTLA